MLVSAMHITAGVWVNDDEPGILEDALEWLDKLAPPSWQDARQRCRGALSPDPGDYRHHRGGEDNGDAHFKNLLVHHQVVLSIAEGRLGPRAVASLFYCQSTAGGRSDWSSRSSASGAGVGWPMCAPRSPPPSSSSAPLWADSAGNRAAVYRRHAPRHRDRALPRRPRRRRRGARVAALRQDLGRPRRRSTSPPPVSTRPRRRKRSWCSVAARRPRRPRPARASSR